MEKRANEIGDTYSALKWIRGLFDIDEWKVSTGILTCISVWPGLLVYDGSALITNNCQPTDLADPYNIASPAVQMKPVPMVPPASRLPSRLSNSCSKLGVHSISAVCMRLPDAQLVWMEKSFCQHRTTKASLGFGVGSTIEFHWFLSVLSGCSVSGKFFDSLRQL